MPDSSALLSFGHAKQLQVSPLLAVMADVINVWAVFTGVILLPTPATGSLGMWLVQLPLTLLLAVPRYELDLDVVP